jgi:hypothetical protein
MIPFLSKKSLNWRMVVLLAVVALMLIQVGVLALTFDMPFGGPKASAVIAWEPPPLGVPVVGGGDIPTPQGYAWGD